VAVFAMSAVAASAASAATEGPFYKVAGKRLAATETKPLKAKASKNFVLTASGVVITCTKLKLSSASKIIGSTGKNPGTSEETLEFEGCTVTGNGEGCEVENGKITTNVVTNTLGYATKERTGKILVLFKPKSGAIFVTVKFTGAKCTFKTTAIEGSVIGEAASSKKAVEVGGEPAEAKENETLFEATTPKVIFIEKEGAIEETKASLKAFGLAASLTGEADLTLEGEPVWGVFT
jgi:hypothetical protein